MNNTEQPQVYIVLMSVVACNYSRKLCERIEGNILLGDEDERSINLKICAKFNLKENSVLTFKLTDFMQTLNSQDLNIEDYYMTYVYAR